MSRRWCYDLCHLDDDEMMCGGDVDLMCQVNGGVAVMYQSDNGDVMFDARCLSQAAPLAFPLYSKRSVFV